MHQLQTQHCSPRQVQALLASTAFRGLHIIPALLAPQHGTTLNPGTLDREGRCLFAGGLHRALPARPAVGGGSRAGDDWRRRRRRRRGCGPGSAVWKHRGAAGYKPAAAARPQVSRQVCQLHTFTLFSIPGFDRVPVTLCIEQHFASPGEMLLGTGPGRPAALCQHSHGLRELRSQSPKPYGLHAAGPVLWRRRRGRPSRRRLWPGPAGRWRCAAWRLPWKLRSCQAVRA